MTAYHEGAYTYLSDNTELRAIKPWARPNNWGGKPWNGWFVGCGRTRDSKALEESNFRVLKKMLDALPEVAVDDSRNGEPHDTPGVVVVREGHWLCGWIEWIAIHETNEPALRLADDALCALSEYPVLDEDDWTELEDEQLANCWQQERLVDRIALCAKHDESIFAARHDYPPNRVADELRSW